MELPDKLYFKIGEVANLTGVKQHVLRYWESEFPSIRPQKSKTNQRLYKRRDVEAVLAVKHLLYDRKFTIEGAKNRLKTEGIDASLPPVDPAEVAAEARKRAMEEVQTSIVGVRRELVHKHEKQLLSLRQQLVEFVESLESAGERIKDN